MSYVNKDEMLRQMEEIDNMAMAMQTAVERKMPIDPAEAIRRFAEIRRKSKKVSDAITRL